MKDKELKVRVEELENKTRSKLSYLLKKIQKIEKKISNILAE